MAKIYDFKAFSSKGKEIDFSQFQGKVLLVVNTASKCGFTPQFAGLVLMITIIGFPWGKMHFRLAKLALSPFGMEVV